MEFSSVTELFRSLLCLTLAPALAGSMDRADGFIDHGVATPISNARGMVATVDGNGRDVVVLWLMDHRGGYALLLIDAATGKSEQVDLPFPIPGESVDAPYASLLSSRNRFYTLFNSHFIEFDVIQRKFTFAHESPPRFAMSMTEDDQGVIWAVNYPQSGVVSYDPRTGKFSDYGEVYHQSWPQYQSFVAADDTGWVYFTVGYTASQIVALDPVTGKATPMFREGERKKGMAYLYRDMDGRVYGQALRDPKEEWHELYRGKIRKVGRHENFRMKPIITGNQTLSQVTFPDGKKIKTCNLIDRKLTVENPADRSTWVVPINYTSEGAHIMGVAVAPDGTICGGTAFPMRFFSYNFRADTWANRAAYGQFNTIACQGVHFFMGGYGGGFLLEWNPAKPWVTTEKDKAGCNPLFLTDCTPIVHRPFRLLAHPDGKTLIMGGTPQYGYTGGGLLFWDRMTRTRVLLTDKEVIPDQSTMSLVALPGGKLLGGTTAEPGTGGEKQATQAELYLMDFVTKKLEWHAVLIPGAQQYLDLCAAPLGLVCGIADRNIFFVFDPVTRVIVQQRDVSAEFGLSASAQGPRVFVCAPNGTIYGLFAKGVVRIDPATLTLELVAASPVAVEGGGDYLDGRIYFTNGSHLYSIAVPQ